MGDVKVANTFLLNSFDSSKHLCMFTRGQANFTTKRYIENFNLRRFTYMNFHDSCLEKNTHAQRMQMQRILFTNKAWW